MDIVERLTAFRDYTGLTNSQFADRAGIPRPTLSQFLNGRNKRLSDDFTAKLHQAYPELNVLWLLFGEGDMVTAENIEATTSKKDPISEISEDLPVDSESIVADSPVENLCTDSEPIRQNGHFDRAETPNILSNASSRPIPAAALPTDPGKKIQSIMVFYSDNSFEIFTPSGDK